MQRAGRSLETGCNFPGSASGPAQQNQSGLSMRKETNRSEYDISSVFLFLTEAWPSAKQDVPSHIHGMDSGLSPPKFTKCSWSTGPGEPICRGRTFTLA